MNLFKLSWKNIFFKPWSTVLTLILFSLGVGLVSLLLLLQHQLQGNFERNLAGIDLVVGAKGSPLQLILSSMYHIDAPTGNITLGQARPFLNPKHPLIKKTVPLSLGDSYRGRRIVGTDTSILSLYQAEIEEGKIWSADFEMTIGAEAAQALGLKLGDTFRSTHGLMDEEGLEHADSEPFRVVGILKPTGSVMDQLLLTTNASFWKVHDHEAESEHEHEHGLEKDHEADATNLLAASPEREITALLIQYRNRSNFQALNLGRNINENTEMQAANPAYEINRLFSLMDTGERALRILALVIVFVSGLSIFISLFASLRHRRYELALIRVMGGSRSTLFKLILLEGILLAAMGSLLGLFLGHFGMELTGKLLEDNYRYRFTGLTLVNGEYLLLLGAVLLGLIAALIPAWQAARTDISETLTNG